MDAYGVLYFDCQGAFIKCTILKSVDPRQKSEKHELIELCPQIQQALPVQELKQLHDYLTKSLGNYMII